MSADGSGESGPHVPCVVIEMSAPTPGDGHRGSRAERVSQGRRVVPASVGARVSPHRERGEGETGLLVVLLVCFAAVLIWLPMVMR